jgi:hypothetical protein
MILWEDKSWLIEGIPIPPDPFPQNSGFVSSVSLILSLTNKENKQNYRVPCLNDSKGEPSIRLAYKYGSDIRSGFYVETDTEFPLYVQKKIEHLWKLRRMLSKINES